MSTLNKLVIATRGSALALWQANHVKARLEAVSSGIVVELNVIKTSGDKILDVPLAKVGGKGLFVKEIEQALVDREADLAVHSMKDVTTFLPDGLAITACLPREDPRDAFFSRDGCSFAGLPAGAVVGTASLRRQAMVLHARPDLRIVPLRGNVETRLRKLAEGAVDATLLALAGLKRLGLDGRATEILPTDLIRLTSFRDPNCRRDLSGLIRLILPVDHLGHNGLIPSNDLIHPYGFPDRIDPNCLACRIGERYLIVWFVDLRRSGRARLGVIDLVCRSACLRRNACRLGNRAFDRMIGACRPYGSK